MSATVTIEIPAASEVLVRRLLALHEELQEPALAARTVPSSTPASRRRSRGAAT